MGQAEEEQEEQQVGPEEPQGLIASKERRPVYDRDWGCSLRNVETCGPGGFTRGDWVCSRCSRTNYADKVVCHIKGCGGGMPEENFKESQYVSRWHEEQQFRDFRDATLLLLGLIGGDTN